MSPDISLELCKLSITFLICKMGQYCHEPQNLFQELNVKRIRKLHTGPVTGFHRRHCGPVVICELIWLCQKDYIQNHWADAYVFKADSDVYSISGGTSLYWR